MSTAQRQSTRKLRAIGRAVPGVDIEPLCRALERQIRLRLAERGAGTYVLGDSGGFVYAVGEDSVAGVYVVKHLPRMLVHFYASHARSNSIELAADLIRHFVAIGYITES